MLKINSDPNKVKVPEYLKPPENRYRTLAELEIELINLPPMRPPRSPDRTAAIIGELEAQLGIDPIQ